MILFDANVLVHAHAINSPFYEVARRLRDQAAQGDLAACVSPQVLCEFFAVITDVRRFRPALSPRQAIHEVTTYWTRSGFRKILPTERTIARLDELLDQDIVTGQGIFDVFLVATMMDNQVRTLYTQNTKDFSRFTDIQAINPFEPSFSERK